MPNSPDLRRRPRSFPLLPEYWQAAEVWQEAGGGLRPVTPVDAASIILIRDSPEGVQIYLCTHPQRSPFGPVAFPGGAVDGADDEHLPWSGPPATEWGRRWNDDVGVTRRTVVAAARELFERTGILLAGTDNYSTVETGDGRDWAAARESILARRESMRDLLETRHLTLRTDLLWPVARWVTPEFLHRRYDTRFFAVILPERQMVTDLTEHPRPGVWVSMEQLAAEDTWLGDTLQAPHTVGRLRSELLGATMSGLLQDLASARSVVEIIARPRDLSPRMPSLAADPQHGYHLVLPGRERPMR